MLLPVKGSTCRQYLASGPAAGAAWCRGWFRLCGRYRRSGHDHAQSDGQFLMCHVVSPEWQRRHTLSNARKLTVVSNGREAVSTNQSGLLPVEFPRRMLSTNGGLRVEIRRLSYCDSIGRSGTLHKYLTGAALAVADGRRRRRRADLYPCRAADCGSWATGARAVDHRRRSMAGSSRSPTAMVNVEPGGQVIDLSDKTVLPGLIDSHVHLSVDRGGEQELLAQRARRPPAASL